MFGIPILYLFLNIELEYQTATLENFQCMAKTIRQYFFGAGRILSETLEGGEYE